MVGMPRGLSWCALLWRRNLADGASAFSSLLGLGIHTRLTGLDLELNFSLSASRNRWLGFSVLTPSIPAVFLRGCVRNLLPHPESPVPRLSWVTFLTARTLADHELTSVFCKERTAPVSPRRVASYSRVGLDCYQSSPP